MSIDQEGSAAGQAPGGVSFGVVSFGCPSCGWTGEFDSRFTAWCEGCGFNADTAAVQPEKRRVARRKARARARAERQCENLLAAAELRPTSATGVAVTAVSTVVHLLTPVLLAGSILVVIAWSRFWFAWPLGLFGVATALVVRPQVWRVLRKPRGLESCLTRADAPKLYALLDRCAAQLGAPVPDYVFIDARFNAGAMRIGLRRKTLLSVGVPLWAVLSGPERIALLGHELGHQVNRDTTRSIWARTARRSLVEWVKLFNPRETARERVGRRRMMWRDGGMIAIAGLLAPVLLFVLFAPVFLIALACYGALNRLDLTCGQRAEHLADELGARLGSSAAAIAFVERQSLGESVRHFVQRQKAARFTGDLWPALREYVDSIPEHEKRRRVFLDEARGTRVDSTHPANYLRRRLLAGRPQLPGAVRADDAEWAAIDAELQPRFDAVARGLLGLRRQPPVSARVPAKAAGGA
jgi:Zn-dependent protease with chaperone function